MIQHNGPNPSHPITPRSHPFWLSGEEPQAWVAKGNLHVQHEEPVSDLKVQSVILANQITPLPSVLLKKLVDWSK